MPRPHKPYRGGPLRITLNEDEAAYHVEMRLRHPHATDSDIYRMWRKNARDPAQVALDVLERFIHLEHDQLGSEVSAGLAYAVANARGAIDPDVRRERIKNGKHPLGALAPPDELEEEVVLA